MEEGYSCVQKKEITEYQGAHRILYFRQVEGRYYLGISAFSVMIVISANTLIKNLSHQPD